MATSQKKSSTVGTAYGKPLNSYDGVSQTSVSFDYEYEALSSLAEVPEDEKLEDEDILAVINSRRNAAARAKAQADIFKSLGITAPALTDAEKAENSMVKGLVLMGTSEEDARAMVRAMLANTPKGKG